MIAELRLYALIFAALLQPAVHAKATSFAD
jgi:hypothetical protein